VGNPADIRPSLRAKRRLVRRSSKRFLRFARNDGNYNHDNCWTVPLIALQFLNAQMRMRCAQSRNGTLLRAEYHCTSRFV
jgi:hypothetical protein